MRQENQEEGYKELELRLPLELHVKDGKETAILEGKFVIPIYWGNREWLDQIMKMLEPLKQPIMVVTKQGVRKDRAED